MDCAAGLSGRVQANVKGPTKIRWNVDGPLVNAKMRMNLISNVYQKKQRKVSQYLANKRRINVNTTSSHRINVDMSLF